MTKPQDPAVVSVKKRKDDKIPELELAAKALLAGVISRAEYDKTVKKLKPVSQYESIPRPATDEEALGALHENKRQHWRGADEFPEGHPVGLRLDIPAYSDHGVWVNSIHDESGAKTPVKYGPVSAVRNAEFDPGPSKAQRVATGETNKSPFAKIKGEWQPMTDEEAVAHMQQHLSHPDYVQVGYDPRRRDYFYHRGDTRKPITHAEHVVQIGPLVLAKNPVYGKRKDFGLKNGGVAHMDKGGQYPYSQAHEQARLNAIKMLGLHEHNTAQDRAKAMGINTDVFHGSKQDIRGGFQPGYDDNLAFVTPHAEFANKWIGKGKHHQRIGDESAAERKAAEDKYREIRLKHEHYDNALEGLQGEEFNKEYDRRRALSKAASEKEFGTYGTPDRIHSTVYPMKVRANKTFNPETDMHVMEEFFQKHGIPQKNIDLYKTGNYMMYETNPVVNYLKSKGYDSMRLRESTGDNYPTVAVFNPAHVRSRFAAFDPARQHENDLLAKRGGRITHAHHLQIEERPL